MGIGFLKHAYMNEILAWSPFSNPIFGVMAPNSGNQEDPGQVRNPEQKKKWLEPLVAGTMQSCFAMTEPDQTRLRPPLARDPRRPRRRRVGHQRPKWFPPTPERALRDRHVPHRGRGRRGWPDDQETQIHRPHRHSRLRDRSRHSGLGHHAVTTARSPPRTSRGPLENQLDGPAPATRPQDRLGAGRVFHCMTGVGQMWRALT